MLNRKEVEMCIANEGKKMKASKRNGIRDAIENRKWCAEKENREEGRGERPRAGRKKRRKRKRVER